MLDNHIYQGNELNIDPRKITWRRCVDMNDRQLRFVVDGLGGKTNGKPREDGYDITVASEIMAVLCLASDITDLKARLGRIIVGYTYGKASEEKPVTAHDLHAEGAMCALLKDALKRRRRYVRTVKRRSETKPGTDSGACTCHRTRRTIRKHRSWLQLCDRNKDGYEVR